jgi:UDP-glucose 4-epimerase
MCSRAMLAGMRVLVTGGAGFIGSQVADALIAAGHEVMVLDDLSSGRRENVPQRAAFREGTLCDDAFVRRAFDEFSPEAVSHQAAQTSVAVSTREPRRDAMSNVVGSIELLQQCVQKRVGRIVYASTGGAVYGEVPEGTRASVDTPARPLSPYACSKFAAECYLRAYSHEYGLRYTILRYANVYGPRQDPHGEAGVVAIFSRRVLGGESIQINARRTPGDDGCVRDYVFVGDVVRYNLLALDGGIAEPIVNVCTGDETSTRKLADMVGVVSGKKPALTDGPRRAGDVERSVLQAGPAARQVPPTSLEQGLRETVAWFKTKA